MRRSVVISAEAQTDLANIASYISSQTPFGFEAFWQELQEAVSSIADFPERFALVPRYEHTGIRRRVVGRYLVFYRIEADRIDILHVLHGAMDYETLLFPG